MDNLHTSNTKLGLILDDRYKTDFVALDIQENKLVTAFDVMFGNSKGHKVLELPEAVTKIRNDLYNGIKEGFLSTDHTQTILGGIKQTLDLCDQTRDDVIRELEINIKDLVKLLYERKNSLTEEINEHFMTERKKIEEHEERWIQKQKYAEDLQKFSRNNDNDTELLMNSHYISVGLKSLYEQETVGSSEIMSSLENVMHIQSIDNEKISLKISHEKFKKLLSEYIKPGQTKEIQFKC